MSVVIIREKRQIESQINFESKFKIKILKQNKIYNIQD